MKIASVATLVLLSAGFIHAQAPQTREQAIAGMHKVDAKEFDSTYTQPAPKAQQLIDAALAAHPEIILIAIHAQPPGHKNVIVASNFGRIGKIGDEDDMRAIHTGKPNLEVNTAGNHFEVEVALKTRTGKTIGALSVVFNYKPGDDKEAAHAIADKVQKEMQAHLPTAASLFGPA